MVTPAISWPTLILSHIIIGGVPSDSRRDSLIRRLLEMRLVEPGAIVGRGAQNTGKRYDSSEYITGLRGGQSGMPTRGGGPGPHATGIRCPAISVEKEGL